LQQVTARQLFPIFPAPTTSSEKTTCFLEQGTKMFYQLPIDPAIISFDPLGILDKEDPCQAEVLTALFETALGSLNSGASPKTLIPTLIEDIAYTIHGNGSLDTQGLRNFLSKEGTPSAVFVALLLAAQALPECFPNHHLTMLDGDNDQIEFHGTQVNTLLAHQFLGTLAQPKGTDWGRPDFTSWFASEPAHYQAVTGYLRTILDHFSRGGYDFTDVFTFILYNPAHMPDPFQSNTIPTMDLVLVEEEHEPSDDSGSPFVLVAANAQPGPGPTATQEERLQSASPALSLSALIIPIIPSDAVVVTSAFPIHAAWKGHNRTARIETLFDPAERLNRHYILADALPLDSMPDEENGLKDLVPGRVDRETKKLFAAFSGASKMLSSEGESAAAVIEAGPWGCGAFGGTFLVKMLCMEIASGLAGVQLRLSITKYRQAELSIARAFAVQRYTIAKLWAQLLNSRTDGDLVAEVAAGPAD
jgi:poly(ADP-ribose) glycohydrolase